jgi:hypothetical protein
MAVGRRIKLAGVTTEQFDQGQPAVRASLDTSWTRIASSRASSRCSPTVAGMAASRRRTALRASGSSPAATQAAGSVAGDS